MAKDKVYFFSTCLIEHIHPQVGLDAIDLLQFCNVEVEVPKYQSCCAQPAYNSGDEMAAKRVARETVKLLCEEDWPVIIPSASCADMLIHHIPKLLSDDKELCNKAHSLSERCVEFVDFIVDHLPSLPSKNQAKTLHLSCSSLRGTGSAESWKRALEKAGFSVQLPAYSSECCGFGGTFSVKAPEISSAMGEDKCRNLLETGSNEFYSGDLGCLMHLNGLSEKNGGSLKGWHLASILRAQYGDVDEG